ncbi:MAG: DUF1292 domain-containing protein [Eubacteriales bacterium]|nr:DUF1292 domain-containing protein [Eubacteriales bacterium]
MEDQETNIVTLQDENGEDVQFEHLMTLEHGGASYVVLQAIEDQEDCKEGEAIILKIEQDEHGEDIYVTIEDADELEAVFTKCVAALEEQDEDEEDDGEE